MSTPLQNRRRLMMAAGGGDSIKNYQPVEYIRSTGNGELILVPTAYINKLINVEIKIYPEVRGIDGDRKRMFGFCGEYAECTYYPSSYWWAGVNRMSSAPSINSWCVFKKEGQYCYKDSITILTNAEDGGYWLGRDSKPIAVFGAWKFGRNNYDYNEVLTSHASRIAYYIIRDANNNEMMHLIPVYRKKDNEPGMFDLIKNKFYTNVGTGAFEVGNPITL